MIIVVVIVVVVVVVVDAPAGKRCLRGTGNRGSNAGERGGGRGVHPPVVAARPVGRIRVRPRRGERGERKLHENEII